MLKLEGLFSERLAEGAPDAMLGWRAAMRVETNGWPVGVVEARLPLSALVPLIDERSLDDVSLRSPARARSYVAGRLCAETALAHAGAERGRREVARSSDGVPRWPPGWRGSISHDATEAVALAAPDHLVDALGVDLEPLLDDEAFHSVVDVCLTPAERACLRSPPEQARREATLRFSAKEAYFKAVHPHVGRFVDFVEAEVHGIDMKAGTFRVLPATGFRMPESQSPLFAMDGRFTMVGNRILTRVARCSSQRHIAT